MLAALGAFDQRACAGSGGAEWHEAFLSAKSSVASGSPIGLSGADVQEKPTASEVPIALGLGG